MKMTLLVSMAAVSLGASASAMTALEALREIPNADRPNLAMIDGHEGNPEPDRWHFLFYDPATENGLREVVVEQSQVVANREVSQFAEKLTADDAVGALDVSVDSDVVTRAARRFASANQREISSMNFALRRDPTDGTPVWTVVCRDPQDHAFASLVMASSDGRIVSHEGFPIDPAKADARRVAKATVGVPPNTSRQRPPRIAQVRPPAGFDENLPPPVYDGPTEYRDADGTRVRRAEPVRRERPHLPNPVDDIIRPVHRFVRGLLPF